MSTGGTPSTQVGLFSTQISEQIIRLRALAQGREGVSGQDLVAIKRAVMATRLLAGSARILEYAALQGFLDRLLSWMQTIEQGGKALTSTEQLILDSVIDLEERLMLRLDEAGGESIDIDSYRAELDDLLGLMEQHEGKSRKMRSKLESKAAAKAAQNAQDNERTESPQPEAAARDSVTLLESLGQMIAHLEQLKTAADDPTLNELCIAQLAELNGRLSACVEKFQRDLRCDRHEKEHAKLQDGAWPRGDDVLDPLWQLLQERGDKLALPISLTVEGDTGLFGPGLHDVIGQILAYLLEDVVNCLAQARHEDAEFVAGEVYLEISLERGRLEIVLRDNAPMIRHRGAISAVDQLSFYRGLGRARGLLSQLNGLVQVEASDKRGTRFVLYLPSDLSNQTYQVLKLDGCRVAVPWVRVVGSERSSGLVFEADETGESFVRGSRNIPLVEVGQFVPGMVPASKQPEQILLVGSVERRLGIFCEEIGEFVESSGLSDPPEGWEMVAYGGLELDGQTLPILDVARLSELRQNMGLSEPGGGRDLLLDSYTPKADEASVATRSNAERLNILLVNQSEFRRREIARVLQRLGHEISFSSDLLGAAQRRDRQQLDVIVTDLRLGQEGMENLAGLREIYGGAKIILTSSATASQATQLAERVGADGCWLDPYRADTLQSILRGLDLGVVD